MVSCCDEREQTNGMVRYTYGVHSIGGLLVLMVPRHGAGRCARMLDTGTKNRIRKEGGERDGNSSY